LLFLSVQSLGQEKVVRDIGGRIQQIGGSRLGNTGQLDSLRRRDHSEDSITISFRYLDSARSYRIDSSVSDFTRVYPVPATYIHLGNTGNAARSIIFAPEFNIGWDPGFHAFDVYKWKVETAQFFQTTRPYSQLSYLLGSRVEQIIGVMHTQNITSGWNVMARYRLINSPGFFKNQRTNHNNYLLTSRFQSRNLRYQNFLILLRNKLQSAENGGIVDTINYLKHPNPAYVDRFNIPTKLGGDEAFSTNFFSNRFNTGNEYDEFTALLRQQYDVGRQDSIVTDSTVVPLFFPRIRFEHSIRYETRSFHYFDRPFSGYVPDSAYYARNYGINLAGDSVDFRERWRNVENDFAIYQFPDARNLHQFIRAGMTLQNLQGEFTSSRHSFHNFSAHGEYRNRTRNGKWDLVAAGRIYFSGLNGGDYRAFFSLERLIGARLGFLQLGFENANRSPYFMFDSRSSFYLLPFSRSFSRENNTQLFASYYLPSLRLRLSVHYYLMNKYTYVRRFFELQQESGLFNVLVAAGEKSFRLGKSWIAHAHLIMQRRIGDVELNLPLLFARARIGYEGNLGFRNLDIAFGSELRYRSPYRADNYSPVLGQFFYQDSIVIRNSLPDISAYVHFRIRSLRAYLRAENLNTAESRPTGFAFTNNNLVAPGYAYPGLQFRIGVYWNFVN